ncbi:hypothetical protein [Gordonia alkaliphila]|uniref:hypothetical protein n=1 Tax=Gordonia alkaliphila TaxID=1053547 RepID=UPI0031E8B29C
MHPQRRRRLVRFEAPATHLHQSTPVRGHFVEHALGLRITDIDRTAAEVHIATSADIDRVQADLRGADLADVQSYVEAVVAADAVDVVDVRPGTRSSERVAFRAGLT